MPTPATRQNHRTTGPSLTEAPVAPLAGVEVPLDSSPTAGARRTRRHTDGPRRGPQQEVPEALATSESGAFSRAGIYRVMQPTIPPARRRTHGGCAAWTAAVRGSPRRSGANTPILHQLFGEQGQNLTLRGLAGSVDLPSVGTWKAPRPGYMAMLEVIAEGPVYRTLKGRTRTDRYHHTETVRVEGEISLDREITEPNPNLDHYLIVHPKQVAQNLHKRLGEAGEWNIKDTDPDGWEVTIYATPDYLIESAEQAAHEGGEDATTETVLREWAAYDRAGSAFDTALDQLIERQIDGDETATEGRVA